MSCSQALPSLPNITGKDFEGGMCYSELVQHHLSPLHNSVTVEKRTPFCAWPLFKVGNRANQLRRMFLESASGVPRKLPSRSTLKSKYVWGESSELRTNVAGLCQRLESRSKEAHNTHPTREMRVPKLGFIWASHFLKVASFWMGLKGTKRNPPILVVTLF